MKKYEFKVIGMGIFGKKEFDRIDKLQDEGWEVLNFTNAWRGYYDISWCYLRKELTIKKQKDD